MYESCYVYDLSGNQLGWIIRASGTLGIKGSNIYDNIQEVEEQLELLNNDVKAKAHWPQLNDPDVQALIKDPQWEPLELEEVDTIDNERSNFVYDEYGGIDWEKSTIVYTKVMAGNPEEVWARTKKAMESVAKERADAS